MKAANEQELTDNTKYQLFKNVSEEKSSYCLSEMNLMLARFDFHILLIRRTRFISCWLLDRVAVL